MTQIAATVNQEATAPSEGSSEWSLWLQYINRAYQEWAEANDWEALRKFYYPVITGMSLASVSLPFDFRKMAASPVVYGDTEMGTEYPEVIPEQQGVYGLNDKFFKTIGNHSDGFTAVLNPGTLASGASILFQYYSVPTSLASNAQVPVSSDPQYLVDRTVAYIFEARSDPRFQLEENKARERLLTMIENTNAAKFSSYAGPNFVSSPERKMGFRIGRD